jgi:hypothetical protein
VFVAQGFRSGEAGLKTRLYHFVTFVIFVLFVASVPSWPSESFVTFVF